VKDPKGRKAVIRFSRKNKEQYVMSENKDGKATGWVAHYDGSKWIADKTKMK
jgi:DNA topoisomerase-1